MGRPLKLSPFENLRVALASYILGGKIWRKFLTWNATQPDVCFVCRRERKPDSWKGPVKKS